MIWKKLRKISKNAMNAIVQAKIAPLRQAEDAVLIDSSDMTIEEVVKAITDNIV